MYLDYLKIKTQLQAGYDADVAPDKSGWNGYQLNKALDILWN